MNTPRLASIFLFAAISIAWSTAYAQFWDGTKLIQALENNMRGDASFEDGTATGYVMGVADTAADFSVCPPSNVSVKQVKRVVFNYLKAHPEKWNEPANFPVLDALRETWPCAK